MQFITRAKELLPDLVKIRRELHRFPEVSWQEHQTTARIKDHLEKIEIPVISWNDCTGAMGILCGESPGPVVALRADIDALPVQEENVVSYRSEYPGIMHACGHDVHATCLIGAAKLLREKRHLLSGTVKFLFQPAEEVAEGAKKLLEKGVLTDPEVHVIFGLHTQPDIPVGQIGLKSGALMASTNAVSIRIKGEGGHGAIPHRTRDPIVAAAAIIQGVQAIVSRRIDPLDSVVISFGSIHGGRIGNVIPDQVELAGTIRTVNQITRQSVLQQLRDFLAYTAAATQTEVELVIHEGLPVLDNAPELISFCRESLNRVFPAASVEEAKPTMGAEDFSLYQENIPGVFLWLGTGNAAKGYNHQWHHPQFDVDEESLAYGAAALAQLAFDFHSVN
ncbi:hypothetical protein AXX12_06590 [Anaerosporomusa subterranea]|uniref:Peptidase M20 dimerisation domain-containing protein n=1 Tax=Anaerosporomusa subterranea TaxID=1794912 RepID=A0A154BQ88_ANASB|nr:M20 family metallopeptidase [Anaerosporomusa subterranea]KYZ76106.1 hypothetical protein AXX12_06590 [Anaerosporomusa subterranea]